MDLELNQLIAQVESNSPALHRYIMKSPFLKVRGSLPFDQKENRYISYDQLREVNLNAKFKPKEPPQ